MHKGPETDEERVRYDLSIVLQHIGDYERAKAKAKTTEQELKNIRNDEVDLSQIAQKKKEKKKNMSDIFNDLYVE